MTIREMKLSDVPQAVQIEQSSFSLPWSEKSFSDAVADANAVFLVADEHVVNSGGDEADIVVGYIGMYLSPPEGEISNVAVAEAFRGGGIGGALMAAMQEQAVKLGIEQIFLEVRCSNTPAIRLYEKAGFEEIGVRRNFYDLPREDAKLMRWNRI
ncbi:MAG: ribosomal protein S18-alanine N-acetyltransferase [Agathobacter sp.]|nr:ribosomal protein S18-alanine N-acetyltransferase [Agathobacter sp.]